MTELPCACPVTDVQAMEAVGATGLIWVAVLKRDPHAPSIAPTVSSKRLMGKDQLQGGGRGGGGSQLGGFMLLAVGKRPMDLLS